MSLSLDQQYAVAQLKANPTGEPMALRSFANGEPVEKDTFNSRQELYEALFGYLEDGRRGVSSKVAKYARDFYTSYFISETFTGVIDLLTRRITLNGGVCYVFGERCEGSGQVVEFGVVDQFLVMTSTGILTAKDVSTYSYPAGEMVVGSWSSSAKVYSPVVPVLYMDKDLHFRSSLIVDGPTKVGSSMEVLGASTLKGTTTVMADLVVHGQLFVSGGQKTEIYTNELMVGDSVITLNADLTLSTPPTEDAGIEVNRGNQATVRLLWKESEKLWRASNGLAVSGNHFVDGTDMVMTHAAPTIRSSSGPLSLRSTDTGLLFLQRDNAATAGAVDFFSGKMQVLNSGSISSKGNLTLSNPEPFILLEDTDSNHASRKAALQVKDQFLHLYDWTPATPVQRVRFDLSNGNAIFEGNITVRGALIQDDDNEDDFQIKSRNNVVITLDSNNNSSSSLFVKNGSGSTVLSVDESGVFVIASDLKFSGNVFSAGAFKLYDQAATPASQGMYVRDLRIGKNYAVLDNNNPGVGGVYINPEPTSEVVIQLSALASGRPLVIKDDTGGVMLSVSTAGTLNVKQDVYARTIRSTNAADDMQIVSNKNIVLILDSDQASSPDNAKLILQNGSGAQIVTVDEAGNFTMVGGTLTLNNGTSNLIYLNPAGLGAPTVSSRSVGTKFALYPALSGTQVDYALGVESGYSWSSVPTAAQGFKWYAGVATPMTLGGDGALAITAGLTHAGNVINPNDHYLGMNTTYDFLRFLSGDVRMSAKGSAVVMLDADNNGTLSIFAVRTNGADGTDLFKVTEAGDATVNQDLAVKRNATIDGNAVVKGNTTLGDANQDIVYLQSAVADIDSRSTSYAMDGSNRLQAITVKDGAATVKTVTYTYGALNRVATKTTVIGGKTITETYTYDANGVPSVSKSVA